MNVTFYPIRNYLASNILRHIFSEHTGIARSLLVSPMKHPNDLGIKSVTAQMPAYHKILVSHELDVQYHLAGYGLTYDEAIIRLVGEAIERYSSLGAYFQIKEKIVYCTYNEIKYRGVAPPFEYLRIYDGSDYERFNSRGSNRGRPIERDDVFAWVPCVSLFSTSNTIWLPAQILFMGHKTNSSKGELFAWPTFSTGTAAHTRFESALMNALTEAIQIDAIMLHWYTKRIGAKILIDRLDVSSLVSDNSNNITQIVAAIPTDNCLRLHVVTTVLQNKRRERPYIVFGSHAGRDPAKAVYRSIMEARAVTYLGQYGPLFSPQEYYPRGHQFAFTDLDSNVGFYADPLNAHNKRDLFASLYSGYVPLSTLKMHASGDESRDLADLIEDVGGISSYAAWLDVTPIEVRRFGWRVVRVFIPELLTMCIPGVPPTLHPRLLQHGGVRNDLPHPLP
jgi:thiazole/oxazole-forming peptide maturase SagD family component